MARTVPPLLVACLTSFNRAESTLQALACLEASAAAAGVRLRAVLTDDGSTDGTASRVAQRFGWVEVLHADGSLFWNRGMQRSMARAMDMTDVDALLWLNDDTLLLPDALSRLQACAADAGPGDGRPPIVVGATCDRQSGRLTYGGSVAASRWRPFSYRKVHSLTEAVPCETMNGNVVLIPAAAARAIGGLDPVFEHAMGDIDYGLRARRLGWRLLVAPGFVGTCSNNPLTGSFADPSLGWRRRWRAMLSRKGLPWRSWLHLTRRHGGWAWPLYFAWPYLRLAVQALRGV